MGRSVIVTGAGQGIGAATAQVLAAAGRRVLVVDRDKDTAGAVASRLDSGWPVTGGHRAFALDVTDAAAVDAFVAELDAGGERIAGLVNGAGVITRQPAEDFDHGAWQRTIGVHLTGMFLVTQAVYRLFDAGAAVVNIASVGSTFGLPGRIAYATAKSGVLGFTRTLAAEWGRRGIRVNAVAPGYVRTEMVLSGLRAGTLDEGKLVARTPLGRLAEPEEIARVIAFLLATDSSFVNGEVLRVDGGLTIDGSFDP